MIDREKVAEALECYRMHPDPQHCEKNDCPYNNNDPHYGYWCCSNRLLYDAVRLLKEQEPILLENQHKPYGIDTNANSPWISRCPRCGKKVEGKQTRFCKYCGQAVKWE